MSFSGDVKRELAKNIPSQKHCMISELTGIITGRAPEIGGEDVKELRFRTDNFHTAKKVFTILKKSFNITIGVSVISAGDGKMSYLLTVYGTKAIMHVLSELKVKDKQCCAVSYARGLFLECGTVNDPNKKSYHLEFVLSDETKAEDLVERLAYLDLGLKITKRSKNYCVYLKNSEKISDLLAAMGASVSVLNFENIKILKETNEMVNRRVNCEISNLKKSTMAAVKQIKCIETIRAKRGLESLPDGLKEMALLRVENPEASLQELGELFDPPMGRSGVNHRLQKLISIAEGLEHTQEGS